MQRLAKVRDVRQGHTVPLEQNTMQKIARNARKASSSRTKLEHPALPVLTERPRIGKVRNGLHSAPKMDKATAAAEVERTVAEEDQEETQVADLTGSA